MATHGNDASKKMINSSLKHVVHFFDHQPHFLGTLEARLAQAFTHEKADKSQ
jgi:hypothetical protein